MDRKRIDLFGTGSAHTPVTRRIIKAAGTLQDEEQQELVFQHSLLCQVSLPRSSQAGRVFERIFKNAALRVEAGSLYDGQKFVEQPLPFGAKPRLALLYINSEAVKKKSAIIDIGESYAAFCGFLRLPSSGKTFYDLKRQMLALAAARLTFGFNYNGKASTLNFKPIEQFDAWLPRDDKQLNLWRAELRLDPRYVESLLAHAVPLPMEAVASLTHSAMALDILVWLSRRLHKLGKTIKVPFVSLREQFGQEYNDQKNFQKRFLMALRQVAVVYSDAKIEQVVGGILLKPSKPIISKITVVSGAKKLLIAPKAIPLHSKSENLTELTTAKFRKLYAGLDVYACKADFDGWLASKIPPEDYQQAFLCFAKKWVKGKF